MKNNLVKETKKIKELINILEATDQECVDQLKNSGYKVLSPTEQIRDSSSCETDTKLKCVIDYLKSKSIPYKVGKHSGNCYILLKGGDTYTYFNKIWYENNVTFWSDGSMSYIGGFPALQVLSDGRKVFQYMYEGNYICSNDVKYNNLKFISVFADGDTNKKIEGILFKVIKPDGSQTNIRVDQILGNSGKLEDLI